MGERLICWVLNTVCCLLYRRAYRRFVGTASVSAVQAQKLMDILETNRNCAYGRRYGFESIRTVEAFQAQAPLTDYDSLLPDIEAMKDGAKDILTSEPLLLFEPTSGSTAASKYIPYTAGLRREFQQGLKPWIYDLYTRYPEIRWGKSYWSVTPAVTRNRYTAGGIPIGFEEDSHYFGRLERWIFQRVFAVPGSQVQAESMEDFYFKTALGLLRCENLRLISVWNPTYLLLILDYIDANREPLLAQLHQTDPKRAERIRGSLSRREYRAIWEHLVLISCWADGHGASYADSVRARFPGVVIQPKGLLATEGFVSLPFADEEGGRLAVCSHFYEFIRQTDGEILLAHELEPGCEYAVVITTSGGLYRYTLQDLVEVLGHENGVPRIRFRGRCGRISDLFGEKLSEGFLEAVMAGFDQLPEFYLFAPEGDRYVFYFKGAAPQGLDRALRESFHYDYCRRLGQLKPLRYFRLTGNPEKEYLDECVRRGQRLGDVKPSVLALRGGWDQALKGEYL